MKKIFVTILKDKFQVGRLVRKDAILIYNAIERRLLRTHNQEKTSIVVKVGKDTINESCASLNPGYLLWILASFLEDYLNPQTLLSKLEKYQGQQP